MSYRKHDKYIDFKINGKLFPSWVMANFKKFKLPEIIIKDDEDPCSRKSKFELRKYQVFASQFLDYKSPYQDILLYHQLGSGKTISAINIYNMLYNYTPGWNVFVLIKATLKDHPWMSDLNKVLKDTEEKDFIMKNITFVSYDSPTADRQFMDAVKNADSQKKNLYIFDEAHNFISNVYSNISSGKGRRAQTIYDYIVQDKKENEGVRVVLLSGTPAINQPFELALLFNLLRPGTFPKSESQFNQLFVTNNIYPTINPATKNAFQRRIMGLVSYYIGSTPDLYATKTINYVDIEMSKYHEDIYTYFEEIEELMAKKKKAKRQSGETYKSYTRQSSNFVFPPINQNIMGENRPRPSKFRLSEREAELVDEGKGKLKLEKGSDKFLNVQKYRKTMDEFINGFKEYIKEREDDDIKSGHTIMKDFETFRDKFNSNYNDFAKSDIVKSKVFEALHTSSAKMVAMIFNILLSKGPVLVYSNYVLMEGLQIFKIYLEFFGFGAYGDKESKAKDGFRWTEYHGGIDDKERKKNLEAYNVVENMLGKVIKIMMISPAGAEGISLENVRQVHLMEPYWHEVRIIQMIGRAVRQCSHKSLPMKERHVDIFRYKSIRKNKGKQTTDQYIEDLARSKDGLIQSFLMTLKEAAIDCNLFKNHNMMTGEYKCFQFDEPSLFDEQIGPAFKPDLFDDLRNNNGSNSPSSQTVRIKVKKIKAVKQLTKSKQVENSEESEEKPKYSKPEEYWFNPNTGVVYDLEYKYPIGKVGYQDDIPMKLEKTGDDIYIINRVIPIPMIDEEAM